MYFLNLKPELMFIKNAVPVVLLFLGNCCLNTIEERTCVLDSQDTLPNPCGYCGVCKTTLKSQNQGICDDHYLQRSGLYSNANSSHCVLINYCDHNTNLCNNDSLRFTGVCFPLFGTYLCQCKQGFYGKNCENTDVFEFSNKAINYDEQSTKHLAVVHNLVFTPIFYSSEFATILISLQSTGFNLSVYIDNGRENLHYNETKCERKIGIGHFCNKLFNKAENIRICKGKYLENLKLPRNKTCLMTLKVPFPRSRDKRSVIHQYIDGVNSSTNPVQGNLETVRVRINNDFGKLFSKQVFEYSFKMINIHKTSDPRTNCAPKVDLINCGASMENMPNISRYTEFTILRSVNTNNLGSVCQEYGKFTSFWNVWRIQENHDELKDAPLFKMFETETYVPNKNKLDYGVYKVQLTVTSNLLDYIVSEKAYCYFKVIRTPIQTTILGGNLKTVYYRQPISFDVFSSVVPDRHKLDKGMKVIYYWRCGDLHEQFCKPYQTSDTIRRVRGPFQDSKTYNFTVDTKVTQRSGGVMEHPETQAIKITSSTVLNLGIVCLKNCGGSVFKSNPQEIVLLEVSSGHPISTNTTLHWMYKCIEDDIDFRAVSTIQDNDSSQLNLLIKRNKLKEGKRYAFRVAVVDSVSSAEILIETDQSPKGAVCHVFPKSGVRGETLFSVSCKSSQVKEDLLPSLTYEFYDRYEYERIGRMVGYSTTGVIAKTMLTRDRLFVRTMNFFGTATENLIEVNLSSPVTKFRLSMESENDLEHKDYIYRMGLISAYSDLLGSRLFWSNEMQILLDHLTKEEAQTKDITGSLMLKNALFITACDKLLANVSETSIFQCESLLRIAKLMYQVTFGLQKSLNRNNTNWRILTTARTKDFVDKILKCSNFVLKANFLFEHMHSGVNVHECLKRSTYYTIDTLDDLVYIIATQVPLIKRQQFNAENIVLIVDEMGPNFDDSVIRTSSLDLKNTRVWKGFKYYIQKIVFSRNPFWWGSGNKINTDVYSFQLNSGNKHVKNPGIGQIVHFYLKVKEFKSLLVQGSVKQPDPKKKPQVNDFEVVVYRIDPETHSETFIEFVNFINIADIKVLILHGERPDFDVMTSKAIQVTQFTRKWFFGLKGKKNTTFYYMGILPGPRVRVGVSVNYSFSLYSARCAVWKYRSWISGEKCVVNKSSDMSERLLICSCTLLTPTIGGYVYNPIITLNPFLDLSLFLKIPENTLTVLLLLGVLLFYSILLIWTKKKDQEDTERKTVLVLEDYSIDNSFMYLVAVFTGSRFGANTTSKVGIKLFGETATSRTHVFSSSQQPILQCGGDDWFLLSTPQHLGPLVQIKLWIDYSGRFPNWFCRKVTVCDLMNSITTSFIIERWFGISINGVCVEVVKKSAASREVCTFRLIFFHNLVQGLREFHIYASIFFKHPRSLITRTQRLSVSLCCVLMAMATTTVLYSLSTPIFEDYAVYGIQLNTFVISLISSLVATVAGLITIHYFRKSYTIVGSKFLARSDVCLSNKTQCNSEENHKPYCLKLLYKYTETYVSSCKVIPVGNTDNTMGLEDRNSKRILAWMICLAITLVSVYVVITASLTYGEIKRAMWLTSLVFTGLITFFIVIPIKVFITAIFLSLLKMRYFDLMLHSFTVNKFLEYITSEKYKNVRENYKSERIIFLHSYIFWHDHCYNKVKKAQYKVIRVWTFFYILEAFILIGVTMWVMEDFETYKNYYANIAVCNEMMTVEMCSNVFDLDIAFVTLRFNVHEYMLPKLFKTKWYNGDAISSKQEWYQETGWMRDVNARLIGDPHLLQVRVQRNLCNVPKMMFNITRTCWPSLSPSTVDRDSYGLSWTHDNWTKIELFSESPWEFVQGSGVGVRTPSDYYLGEGGYIATLLRTLDAAKLVYTNLIDTNWIDDRTRVVVLEFVTYNANNNIITSSYFVTETYPTNIIRVSYTIRSKSHYYHEISFQSILFIILSVYFIIRTLGLLNIMGVENFFESFWNWYDIVFSILYIIATVKYIHLLYLLGTDEEKAEAMVINRHVYLEVLFQAKQDTIIYICYTFGVAAFRLIRIAGINDSCKKYLSDILETRNELILTVMLSFSSIYIMYRLVMYHLEPPTVYDFMDILQIRSDFYSLSAQYDSLTGKLSAYILGRLSDITMFSFTISLLHHQKQITMRRLSVIDTSL